MMIYLIDVWVNLEGQQIKAGELICEINPSNGKSSGAFRYSAEYMGNMSA